VAEMEIFFDKKFGSNRGIYKPHLEVQELFLEDRDHRLFDRELLILDSKKRK
jgi:hypothetical protein